MREAAYTSRCFLFGKQTLGLSDGQAEGVSITFWRNATFPGLIEFALTRISAGAARREVGRNIKRAVAVESGSK